MKTAINYTAIRSMLTPRRRVLTWDAQRELLHLHDADFDADWPAPTSRATARDLMRRLPYRARVLCAYIAAEMVLPLWEQWADGWMGVDADAPRRALELARRWLDGEPVKAQVLRDAANDADADAVAYAAAYAAADIAYAAAYAAYAAADAAAAAADAADAAYADAADAAYAADIGNVTFYTRWWARCRARLTIANPATAELEAV